MSTISTHNGSAVHQAHNRREKNAIKNQAHISKDGKQEIWIDIPVQQAYRDIFKSAVDEYNSKQNRQERKIKNYYDKVLGSAKQHPAYEMIIGIYNKNEPVDKETGKKILKQFVDDFEKSNSAFKIIGAYYHADEAGEPHVHIDYIPIAHYKSGMKIRTGLNKALEEMGFITKGALTAQIQWEHEENQRLEEICHSYNIEIEHPKNDEKKHLETELFKAQKQIEDMQKRIEELQEQIRFKDLQKSAEKEIRGIGLIKKKEAVQVLTNTKAEALVEYNRLIAKYNSLVKERNQATEAANFYKKEAEELHNNVCDISDALDLANRNKPSFKAYYEQCLNSVKQTPRLTRELQKTVKKGHEIDDGDRGER